MLIRFACYLIAQNGDSKKEEVAFNGVYPKIECCMWCNVNKRCIEK